MRGGAAKASVFFLVALLPASIRALPTHKLSTNAAVQDDSILLRQGTDGVYAQFQASCASCPLDGENVWPVDFFIGGTNGPCDNVSVSVNGQQLSHHWEGQFTSGSGSLPSSPSNESAELQATWQSICITAPLGAPHNQNAHVLTVILDNERSHGLEDNIGFTISFGGYQDIEVLRVSNFPVDLSDESEWGDFIHPEEDIGSNTDSELDPGFVSVEMKLEAELQKLQVLHYELRQLQESVTLQEKKIRDLLKKDCKPLLAKWGQCEDFFCYVKSSWQKVPEFYWSIRYRFGLLGSGKIIPICRAVPEQPSNNNTDSHRPSSPITSLYPTPTPSKYLLPTDSENVSPPSPTSNVSDQPFVTTSPLPPTITPPPQEADHNSSSIPKHSDTSIDAIVLPVSSPTKHFLRSCAIILLIVLLCGLLLRIVRHTTTFRRRRRDIASRREEYRTRRAYRNAARRLRWRRWWEGWTDFQAPSVTSEHSLAEFQHARGVAHDGNEGANNNNSRRPSHDNDDSDSDMFYSLSEDDEEDDNSADERHERRMMQAEILGLRRVLEYVGDLVGADPSAAARRRARSRSRSGPPPYERGNGTRHSSTRRGGGGGAGGMNDISSTPAISASGGLGSPRASTMFSLETGSLVTLETIDTLDSGSAPPSYHP